MKNKLISKVIDAKNKIKESAPALVATAIVGASMMQNVAFAADVKTLFGYIVKGFGGLLIAGASIRAIMGLSAYTEAKSEGEGPEMSKAKNQITASIMGVALGIALVASGSKFGDLIGTITFG